MVTLWIKCTRCVRIYVYDIHTLKDSQSIWPTYCIPKYPPPPKIVYQTLPTRQNVYEFHSSLSYISFSQTLEHAPSCVSHLKHPNNPKK